MLHLHLVRFEFETLIPRFIWKLGPVTVKKHAFARTITTMFDLIQRSDLKH